MVPREPFSLRDHMDHRFSELHDDIQEVKAEVVANRVHRHREHPTWGQLWGAVGILVVVGTPILFAIFG